MALSLELSTIQYNSLQSAIINAQVDEFLRHGGQITATPPMKAAPLPYGRLKPVDKSTKLVREKTRKNPGRTARSHSPELIERIGKMAETMSCPEIAAELGMTYDQIKCLGSRHGFVFAKADNKGHQNLVLKTKDPDADRKNVERIKAFRDLGVSRKQAYTRMGISVVLFLRLVDEYDIDYPKCIGGKRWEARS